MTDYDRVADAIRFVRQRAEAQPSLDDVAAHLGLSPAHTQRLFSRWAGVSPKRFVQHLTHVHARRRLRDGATVFDTALDTGLSGAGRLHDLFLTAEAATPGEVRSGGEGVTIRLGRHATPLGLAVVAVTDRGVCALHFCEDGGEAAEAAVCSDWPAARIVRDDAATAPVAEALRQRLAGEGGAPLHVVLRGTPFQLQVWRALLQIPEGAVATYGGVAAGLGRPRAVRAVAGAISKNPVGVLVPCHRVLRSTGELSGYRWGPDRKAALLAVEAARLAA